MLTAFEEATVRWIAVAHYMPLVKGGMEPVEAVELVLGCARDLFDKTDESRWESVVEAAMDELRQTFFS